MSTFSNPLTEYSPQMESLELEARIRECFGRRTPRRGGGDGSGGGAPGGPARRGTRLGSLLRGAAGALGKVVSSPAGKAIGGMLKKLAKKALPVAGGAVGAVLGGPLGARLGQVLASDAGRVLGLELEGLSTEDREVEAARQFVRFAAQTVRNALDAPPGNPARAAYEGALEAARVYAPGLMDLKQATSGENVMHDIDRTQVGFGYEAENSPYDREQPSPYSGELESEYEMEEAELVNELMEVQSEEEFESFLSNLLSRAVSAAGGFLGAPTGKALGGLLKGAAKQICLWFSRWPVAKERWRENTKAPATCPKKRRSSAIAKAPKPS